MKRILVCRIGAFGDVCMTLPVVNSLAEQFEVHWLIRQNHAVILKLFPDVKCHPVVFTPEEGRSFISRLDAAKYDALLDFSNWSIVGALASRLKNIPVRAVAYDSTRRLLLQRIKYALPWFKPFNKIVKIDGAVHRVFKWQQLVKAALGYTFSVHWPLEPVKLPGDSLRIFLHPHASKPNKLWPIDNFVAVLSHLAEQKATQCFINEGNSREKNIAEELGFKLRRKGLDVTFVPLDSSFLRLREALEQVDFAFGPDSGPMHFASLLGVPSLVVYGPYSPAEVAPLWRTVAVSPPGGPGATQTITPAMALDGISRLFSLLFDRSDVGVRL
jgi:ADP-heptose:LPS heptosyltransferase